MKVSDERKKVFQDKIFSSWAKHKRDLPWRKTADPYKIMISEVMLQQTQVSRVIERYLEFIERYPTVHHLAQATKADVLRTWQGLGYNRRALYLHESAQRIVKDFKGIIPKNEQQLLTLPGLGKYTARAILIFAYKQDIAMVDTNIKQIITQFFFGETKPSEKELHHVAEQLVPKGKAWEWHQALMDYGALVLQRTRNLATKKQKHVSFKESNRFFRGRVMDQLWVKKHLEVGLLERLATTYKKPQDFMKSILDSLEHDGLITRSKDGIISLPE